MAFRNRTEINPAWILLDTTAPLYSARVNTLGLKHAERGTFNQSVATSDDGTRALVKVADADRDWLDSFKAGALRIYTEADHDEAVPMVQAWDAAKG